VRTFVVGFNLGPGGANLTELASAGGTNKAFLINGGDVACIVDDAQHLEHAAGVQVHPPTPAWVRRSTSAGR
jgi:hypothetical protein